MKNFVLGFGVGVLVLMSSITQCFAAQAATRPGALTKAVTKNELQRLVFNSPGGSSRVAETRSVYTSLVSRERSCIDVACTQVGCNFESDAADLARACAGNYDGSCLQVGCAHTSCNFKTEVVDLATACRANFGDQCVKTACSTAGCNFKSDFVDFANACQGVDGDCVRILCQRSGCHFRSDVLNVINSCRGN